MTDDSPLRCVIIAGPNGSGKTTFAREFLAKDLRIVRFVNVDLIAGGLSPLKPDLAALTAGRIFLNELGRLASQRVSFAFESTLSGLTYVSRIKSWKASGYRIGIVYLWLSSAGLACRRVAARVREGGHDVPQNDVARRYLRSWENFRHVYSGLADHWAIYDNSGQLPVEMETSEKDA
jgi:predicted ABC-type ATPase